MINRKNVHEALLELKKQIPDIPKAVIVLGSGLGSLVDEFQDPIVIPYEKIPHWPVSTAPGHAGHLVSGRFGGVHVLAMQGRVHYYEGYSMEELVFPVRVFGKWGIPVYLATNASGGINFSFSPGDLVLIQDHINFFGDNPLIGQNEDDWGSRFPDMSYAYSRRLMSMAEEVAQYNGILLKRGVYIGFSGPSYETPAEIRMARAMGADLVGMSTVPEVIVANHMGMEVCAVSCVANYAAGMTEKGLSEEEVLEEMSRSSAKLIKLMRGLLIKLGELNV